MKIINLIKRNKYRKFINPYYRIKKSKLSILNSSLRAKVIVVEVITLTVGLIWFFYFSTVYDINSVEVIGARKIPSDEIVRVVRLKLNKDRLFGSSQNIFLFDVNDLKKDLNNIYYLTSLEVLKYLPNKVEVLVVEKEYSAIWKEGDSYYYIDEVGKVIDRANPLEIKKSYPLIDSSKENKFNKNRIIGEEDGIDFVIGVFKTFRKDDIDLLKRFDSFVLDSTDTLKIVLIEGPEILFSLANDSKKQVLKLVALKNQKLKDDFYNKEYIDLRYGDRVYYR